MKTFTQWLEDTAAASGGTAVGSSGTATTSGSTGDAGSGDSGGDTGTDSGTDTGSDDSGTTTRSRRHLRYATIGDLQRHRQVYCLN